MDIRGILSPSCQVLNAISEKDQDDPIFTSKALMYFIIF